LGGEGFEISDFRFHIVVDWGGEGLQISDFIFQIVADFVFGGIIVGVSGTQKCEILISKSEIIYSKQRCRIGITDREWIRAGMVLVKEL